MIDDMDNFKAKVKTVGGGSLMVIIPSNIVKFAGLQEQDQVKVWIKKTEDEE